MMGRELMASVHGNPMKTWLQCQPQGPIDVQWENACQQYTSNSDHIEFSWHMQIRWRCIKSRKLKRKQLARSDYKSCYVPMIAEKASV